MTAMMQSQNPVGTKSGTQDKIEGTAKNLAGKVKEATGKTIGNPRLEAQGVSDQIAGNAQKKVGQIKQVFGK
jgi:uncharacterized protein YjbJ (UPF0337 family)